MVTVEFTEEERDALQRFVLEYAPDANLAEDWGFDMEAVDALDRAYDKLFATVVQ